MSQKDSEPLRGEAAWKAAKQEIAKRNEAAYARGREQRAAQDAARRRRVVALDREEAAMLRSKKPTTPRAEG